MFSSQSGFDSESRKVYSMCWGFLSVQDVRHDDITSKLQTLPCIFNLRAEVAPIAVLHDDAQMVLTRGEERILVADNIGVVQPPQEIHLRACSSTTSSRRTLKPGNPGDIYTLLRAMLVAVSRQFTCHPMPLRCGWCAHSG